MAACLSQIKNITALSFYLFVLIINRMLALLVFKNAKGTGSASNKALKFTPFGRWDAYTRGGFAIMPHVSAPLSLKLEGVSLNYVWLYKNIRSTTLTCCSQLRRINFKGRAIGALSPSS